MARRNHNQVTSFQFYECYAGCHEVPLRWRALHTAWLVSLFCAACLIVGGCTQQGATGGNGDESTLRPVVLRIHAWTGYAEPFQERFVEKMKKEGFAVEVEISSASGLASFTDHLKNKKAHLVSPAHDLTLTLIDAGLVQPFAADLLPHVKQVNPLIGKRLAKNEKMMPYIAPYTFGPYALAYRKDKFKEAPNSYDVLWAEENRMKVSLADYDTANIYLTALRLGIPENELFTLSDEQLATIEQELLKLHTESKPIYWGDNLPVDQAEQLHVGTDWGVGVQQINERDGAPEWGFVIPEEGATAWVDTWMLGAHVSGDEKQVAHAFVDFVLQPEIQAEVARVTSYGVVNMYASRHMTAEEITKFQMTDGNYVSRMIFWEPLAPEFLAKYQALWQRVKK